MNQFIITQKLEVSTVLPSNSAYLSIHLRTGIQWTIVSIGICNIKPIWSANRLFWCNPNRGQFRWTESMAWVLQPPGSISDNIIIQSRLDTVLLCSPSTTPVISFHSSNPTRDPSVIHNLSALPAYTSVFFSTITSLWYRIGDVSKEKHIILRLSHGLLNFFWLLRVEINLGISFNWQSWNEFHRSAYGGDGQTWAHVDSLFN